ANQEKAFVLDMSTTVVSRGKIEVCERDKKALPLNWAVDKTGRSAADAGAVLNDMFHRYGGGILPLGGEGEQYGGYKGYGLAVMVDILCAVLCGAPFGMAIHDTETSSARVSHFFGALKIDRFRKTEVFRDDMDKMLRQLRETPVAEGSERVWFAGEKEFEFKERAEKNGVPVSIPTWKNLKLIAEEFGLSLHERK
ncbi:MAG: Ldh family oxidoreductase, partial [Victivallales bacterium]